MFEVLINYVINDPISFTVDILLTGFLGYLLCITFLKKIKTIYKVLITFAFVILCVVLFNLELKVVFYAFVILMCIVCFYLVFFANLEKVKSSSRKKNNDVTNLVTRIPKDVLVNSLVETITSFSYRKMGAIITFEKHDSLNNYKRRAVKIDADFSKELLRTIFFPNTALHDGAVIIKGSVIECAAAYYPLSDNPDLPSSLGTRHRAALGISEETDAFSIIVSEETGSISYTVDGTITTNISEEVLRDVLNEHILYE